MATSDLCKLLDSHGNDNISSILIILRAQQSEVEKSSRHTRTININILKGNQLKAWACHKSNTLPSALRVAQVYDQVSATYADTFIEPSFCIDHFIKYLPAKALILDIGCGPGRDAGYFIEKGYNVEGIDISEKMIEAAQSNCPKGKFSVADMRNLNYPAGYFDAVFSSFSLIHIPKADVPDVLQSMSKALKPGGLIHIAIQEGKSEEIEIPEPFKPDEMLFLNIMSRQELKSLLKTAGFETLRFFGRKPISEQGEFNFTKYVIVAKKI